MIKNVLTQHEGQQSSTKSTLRSRIAQSKLPLNNFSMTGIRSCTVINSTLFMTTLTKYVVMTQDEELAAQRLA